MKRSMSSDSTLQALPELQAAHRELFAKLPKSLLGGAQPGPQEGSLSPLILLCETPLQNWMLLLFSRGSCLQLCAAGHSAEP